MAMATTSLLFLAFSTMLSAHFMSVSCSSPPATRCFQPLHAVAFFSSTALASMAAAAALAFSSSMRRLTPAARLSWSTTALSFSSMATSGSGAGFSGASGFTSCSFFTSFLHRWCKLLLLLLVSAGFLRLLLLLRILRGLVHGLVGRIRLLGDLFLGLHAVVAAGRLLPLAGDVFAWRRPDGGGGRTIILGHTRFIPLNLLDARRRRDTRVRALGHGDCEHARLEAAGDVIEAGVGGQLEDLVQGSRGGARPRPAHGEPAGAVHLHPEVTLLEPLETEAQHVAAGLVRPFELGVHNHRHCSGGRRLLLL
uniref:Uncharacterized protein n=1 Tax=Triticum urartu TaxID=4572 RepID=A0A8R7VHI9_TRIUA